MAAFVTLLAEQTDPADIQKLLHRAKLLAMNTVPDEAFEPPVTPLGQYLDTPIEVPPALVHPTIVVRGEITATLGRAGYGKTTMNLNRLLRWGAGLPLFDSFASPEGEHYLMPDKPLRVLIIENEGSAGMFHQKIGVMLNNGGNLNLEQKDLIRENVWVWGDGGYSGLKLDDPAMLHKVRQGVEKVDPDIIFIEPFRSLWKGEENSSTDMANMVDNLVAMATDYGCGVILSHHERKSGAGEDGELMSAGRGSTVLEGVVALMENFQKVKGPTDYRELTWSKARYLQPPPPTRMEYDSASMWYRHVALDEIEAIVIRALEEAQTFLTVSQLTEETGESDKKLRQILRSLVDAGRVKKAQNISDGRGSTGAGYRLPSGDAEQHGGLAL